MAGLEPRPESAEAGPPGRADGRFRRRERLHLDADFARVLAFHRRAQDPMMTVFVGTNGLEWSRLGIRVPKRIGNAVQRHYARRRIREAFRRHKGGIPRGYDVVCVAREAATDRRLDVAASLLVLIEKAIGQVPSGGSGHKPRSPGKTAR